ncbi:hypothetical protein Avbf_06628 [Armadillidium vulgare]|nr:hypothetical protein Avbf_06628 [Armadillidium vulgare]
MIAGVVISWAQLTIHQSTLNLSSRDTASFTSVSALLGIIIPLSSGAVADKIGNFVFLVSGAMILMGVNAFGFIFISEVKLVPLLCNATQNTNIFMTSNEQLIYTFADDTEYSNVNEVFSCSSEPQNITSASGEISNNINASKNCSILKFQMSEHNPFINPCNQTLFVRDAKSHKITYWSYLVTRTFYIILTSISFTLFEGAVMLMDKENNIDFGLQRAWGTFAALTSAYIGGVLVSVYSEGKPKLDFT